jgi:DNA-binding response OmpR family regulator
MDRILLVDDSKAIRLLVGRIIESLGYTVDSVSSGEEGLTRLGKESYQLAVIDITMPGMDGVEMVRTMRDRGDITPVVILTSQRSPDRMGDLDELGVEDYLVKPVTPEDLKATFEAVLERVSRQSI